MWIYLNDRFVRKEDAVVSVFDHGLLYGDGVYETLRSYGGLIFMLQEHVARLRRSAELIGLDLPLGDKDWPALLREALRRNTLDDAYLRITVSRGAGEIGLDPALCKEPTTIVMALPLKPYSRALYDEGVHLARVQIRRNLAAALPPKIKSLNFLNNILAKREALQAGAFDGIMLNAEGDLTECTASNLFFVQQGGLCTPSVDCGILDGITRNVVLQLAREHGVPTQEGRYPAGALYQAEECFVTNTTLEIMPVSAVDHQPIGSGRPGPLTMKLRNLFHSNLGKFLE
ncbi:MAG: aminotransferase class IV [Nitrospiraceae bacterium]